MIDPADARSGKGHRDENFPVAGIIAARHRPAILAFYNFVRNADDIADHPTLSADEKIALLDRVEAELKGPCPADSIAAPLHAALAERDLPPRHALDLLAAFRLDARKTRYKDFGDLIAYCRLSAMPVGRFVLDVHGERESLWPANDDLCAALQIINHVQDCGEDYAALGRVYLPQDILAAHGADVSMLSAAKAPPQLREALADIAQRTQGLLANSAGFADGIRDLRLGCEVAAIQKLAERLNAGLLAHDPLSEKVHAGKAAFLATAASAAALHVLRRLFQRMPALGRANS